MELTNLDLEALADLIRQGNTSGILDSEDENGNSVRISWALKTDKFTI